MPSETFQAHILYSGMVQGVGFRYTTQRIAASLGLKGWVRNLRDGQVEILAEGKKDKIEALMNELGAHFGSYIRDQHSTFQNSQGEFKDFQIIA
jgi:acylphosphatase